MLTFDGQRVAYAALTDEIRRELKAAAEHHETASQVQAPLHTHMARLANSVKTGKGDHDFELRFFSDPAAVPAHLPLWQPHLHHTKQASPAVGSTASPGVSAGEGLAASTSGAPVHTVYLHRFVMALRSAGFAALLAGPWAGREAVAVPLGGSVYPACKALVQFLYTDSVQCQLGVLGALCQAGEHLDMPRLVAMLAECERQGYRSLPDSRVVTLRAGSMLKETGSSFSSRAWSRPAVEQGTSMGQGAACSEAVEKERASSAASAAPRQASWTAAQPFSGSKAVGAMLSGGSVAAVAAGSHGVREAKPHPRASIDPQYFKRPGRGSQAKSHRRGGARRSTAPAFIQLFHETPGTLEHTMHVAVERLIRGQPSPEAACTVDAVVQAASEHCIDVHLPLLKSRSSFFSSLFSPHFAEGSALSRSGVKPSFHFGAVDKPVAFALLRFMYCSAGVQVFQANGKPLHSFAPGHLAAAVPPSQLTADQAVQLLYAADLYLLTDLRAACAAACAAAATDDTACAFYRAADDFSLKRLAHASAKALAMSLDVQVLRPEFLQLVLDSAASIQDREEDDSVPVLDDIAAELQAFAGTPFSALAEAELAAKAAQQPALHAVAQPDADGADLAAIAQSLASCPDHILSLDKPLLGAAAVQRRLALLARLAEALQVAPCAAGSTGD